MDQEQQGTSPTGDLRDNDPDGQGHFPISQPTVKEGQIPENVMQSQSAHGAMRMAEDENSPFMWASPLSEKSIGSSPQLFQGKTQIEQDQSSPIDAGRHFSRDIFLQTGRFDRDIDMLLKEADMSAGQSPGEVVAPDESLVDEDEEALKVQLRRHLPDGTSSLTEEQIQQIDNQSIDQSNFTLGELSLSADSYTVDESTASCTNQSQLSSSELMNQSIRSALAGLNSKHEQPANTGNKHPSQLLTDEEIPFQEEAEKAMSSSERQQTAHPLNDSFSSEVTEPEEQVEREPPMALLMYSQPKVWTDDSGKPTSMEEGEEEVMADGQEGNEFISRELLEESPRSAQEQMPSASGMWLQDEMLQTVVPGRLPLVINKEGTQTDHNEKEVIDSSGTRTQTPPDKDQSNQENIANLSSNSKGSLQSPDANSSRSNTSTHDRTDSSEASRSSQNHQDKKNTSSSSFGETPAQHDKSKSSKQASQTKIPQTTRNVSRKTSSSHSQNTSRESSRNTSTSNPNERQIKVNSKTQVKHADNKKHAQTANSKPAVYKEKNTGPATVQGTNKVSARSQENEHDTSDGSLHRYQGSQDVSHRKSGENENSRGGVPRKAGQSSNGKQAAVEQVRDVISQPSHIISAQEAMFQQLHQSRLALLEQSQKMQGQPDKGHFDVSSQGQQNEGQPAVYRQDRHQQSNQLPKERGSQQFEKHGQEIAIFQGQSSALYQGQQLQGHQVQGRQGQNQYTSWKAPPEHQGQLKTSPRSLDVEELLTSTGTDIFSMEQVRGHLQNMLKQTTQTLPEKSYDSTQMQSLLSTQDESEDESFLSTSTFPTAVSSKSLADLTAQMESLSGYGPGPVGSGGGGGGGGAMVPRGEATLYMENQLVRESLEKEMFRRKHCEKQIHLLQSKLLEVQQQLAVAVSTDRKKDTMIEQLDKALAKVVEGWRKREAEKVEIIQRLQTENEHLSKRSEAQLQLLHKFETETAVVVDQLTAAQQRVEEAERDRDYKVTVKERERLELLESLDQTQEQLQTVTIDREQLSEQVDKLGYQLGDTRSTLEAEREAWEEKEQEYLQKIDEITNNHLRAIEIEKNKSDQQGQILRETHEVLAAAQTEVHETRMKLDTVTREKESLHVQLGILEAKMESSLRKQEADLRSEAEREMSEKLNETTRRHRASEEESNERHRHQVYDMSQRHTTEIKELHRQHQDALRRKDEALTQKALEFEEKLGEAWEEMSSLQTHVKKLEGQKMEVAVRLQSVMQAHCNEALRLLSNGTPPPTALTNELTKHLTGMYTVDDTSPSTDQSHAAKELKLSQEDAPNQGTATSLASHLQASDIGNTEGPKSVVNTSSEANPVQFFALKPDVSSPPEPLVTLATSQHGNTPGSFSSSTMPPQTMSSMAEDSNQKDLSTLGDHPSFSNTAEVQSQRDHFTGMPFQRYSGNTNQGHQVVYPGFPSRPVNPSYQGNQSYQNDTSFRALSSSSQGANIMPGTVSMAIPITTTSVSTATTNASMPNQTLSSWHPNMSTMSTESGNLAGHEAHPQRHVSMRLEPSFLETLAKEAEQLGGYRGSQNSSMMSEYDGVTPLLPDTSMSTVTGDVTHGNMTELSVGPLSEQSQYSDMSRLTTGRLSEAHHQHSRQATSMLSNEMNYSTMSERPKQEERQQELQKYLSMLLQQSPGSSRAEETITDRDERIPPSPEHSLNATPTKAQPSPLQFRGQGQAHPQGVAFTKTTVLSSELPRPQFGGTGQPEDQGTDSGTPLGVLSPGQVGEISRLLGIYRSRAAADPSALEAHNPHDPHYRGSADASKAQLSQQKGVHPGSQTGQQGAEVFMRGQQPSGGQGQKVIKVPTGTDAASVRNSPPRPKAAARGPVKPLTGRAGAPPNKPKTAPGDKKEKQKAPSKVWK